jgi:hypothetical protein
LRSGDLAGHSIFPLRGITQAGNISLRTPIAIPAVWAVALSCWNHTVWVWDILWGYLKSNVYGKKQRTTQDLKQNIREEVAAIPPTMLQRVMQNPV